MTSPSSGGQGPVADVDRPAGLAPTGSMPVTLLSRPLHPRHGPHRPVTSTPRRRLGSVRRTSSIDMLRPEGMAGPMLLRGRARDLSTHPDGRVSVLAEASVEAEIDFAAGFLLRRIATVPALPTARDLVGVVVSSGFRGRVAELLPGERATRTPLHLLLDDLPGAALVSGHATIAAGTRAVPAGRTPVSAAGVCAGFAVDGTMLTEFAERGEIPVVTGPSAPDLEPNDDPWAWHALDPLPEHGMRRCRRTDLIAGDPFVADAHFRDTHMSPADGEVVVHEYAVAARVNPSTMAVTGIDTDARTLPWVECPRAVASAARLVGRHVGELREWVRGELVGTSTCTHLNDTLRSLEDIAALAALLPPGR